MIKIAICDDNIDEINSHIEKLEAYAKFSLHKFEYETKTYISSEALVADFSAGEAYDIILLDIYMGGQNGIDAARKLRKLNYKGQIIFLTSSFNYSLAAFEVDATQYLVKPVLQEPFSKAMDKAAALLTYAQSKTIVVRSGGEDHSVAIDNICYSETNAHYQEINLASGRMLSVRSTATSLFQLLSEKNFIQIGKTYIVNISHIKK